MSLGQTEHMTGTKNPRLASRLSTEALLQLVGGAAHGPLEP